MKNPTLVSLRAATPALSRTQRRSRTIGLACGLGVATIWAGWLVATRFAVTTSLGPWDVTLLRYGVSALLLALFVPGWRGAWRNAGPWPMLLMLVGAGVPFMALSATAMQFAPAAYGATFKIGLMPIFVALLSYLVAGERLGRLQRLGVAAVVLGVAGAAAMSAALDFNSGQWRGALLFMAAGFLFAAYTVAQRRSGLSAWHATALVNIGSCVLFAPVYFLFLEPRLATAPVAQVAFQALAQGVLNAVLALFLFTEAVRRLGSTTAAIFGALVPMLTLLMEWTVLGEKPAALTLAAAGVVTFGVVLVVCGRPKPSASAP